MDDTIRPKDISDYDALDNREYKMSNTGRRCIQIRDKTYQSLFDLGNFGDSFDSIIMKLVESHTKAQEVVNSK